MTPLEYYRENMRYQGWIGPGWEPMVFNLDNFILNLVPDYTVLQVKEKFGGLRFYYSLPGEVPEPTRQQIRRVVDFAESLSTQTCEECGGSGTLLEVGRWWRTLCPPCYDKAVEDKKKRWETIP